MLKLTFRDFFIEEFLEFLIILATILLSMSMGLYIQEKGFALGPIMVLILGTLILLILIKWKADKRFNNYIKNNN